MKKKTEKLVTETILRGTEERLDTKISALASDLCSAEKRLETKIDGVEKRLDAKIDRVVLEVVKNQHDIKEIKATMATKQDINMLVERFDSFIRPVREIDQEQRVQALHIKEHHERISALEAAKT